MTKKEIMTGLENLMEKLSVLEEKEQRLAEAERDLQEARERKLTAVMEFDRITKPLYIKSQAGEEPEKPTGLLNQAPVISHVKKKGYEDAMEAYQAKCRKAEQKYEQVYAEKRKALLEEERKEKEEAIRLAKEKRDLAESEWNKADQALDDDTLLGKRYQAKDAVERMIKFFQDDRVDTIKEAINLLHEEEHFRQMEEDSREQLRLLRETRELAMEAMELANSAALKAEEALGTGTEAFEKAKEALDRADQALKKGDDVMAYAKTIL